jgi:hypothetical protein
MNFLTRITTAYKIASDWRLNDRRITLGNKTMRQSEAVSIIANLKQQSQQLTQKTIEKWRRANVYASNIENPKRYDLYAIYDDAMHDLHLKGSIRNRKLAVLGKPFKITDLNGETNQEVTILLKSRWFKKFMSLALDSRFYGHSLIELIDIDRDSKLKFRTVNLVPRHHVCPEYGVLLREASDDPKKGIPYRGTPIMDTCIEVGDTHDLGELDSVAKEAISKKFILQFWDLFAEIFGMPLRVAKTTSRDPKDHTKIENMLEAMGAAAWGLFPEGTTLELKESKQGDAFEVYDKRIERANSEMSKAILGQTMTMDNGSSKSQAEVHENVADEVAEDDRDFIRDVVNDDLFPFLIKWGFPVKNLIFEWDDAREYTPEEMKEIEAMLLDYFDIDPEYFIEKYNVKIIGKKETIGNAPLQDPEKKKKKSNLSMDYYG